MPDYISVKEAAELSGYHVNYVRRLARAGKIKADKKGGWWIYRDDFIRYVEEMKALGNEKFNRFRVRDNA